MTEPSDILNVARVAKELRLSPRAVLHRITKGKIRAEKIGQGRTSSYVVTAGEVERVKRGDAA